MASLTQSKREHSIPQEIITALKFMSDYKSLESAKDASQGSLYHESSFFLLNVAGYPIAYNTANTTPKKVGQFVTMWKRITAESEIASIDSRDPIDFVVVQSVNKTSDNTFLEVGHFIMPCHVLIAKDIISVAGKGGKRGFRIYPPWAQPIAKDAIKSQMWQRDYYFKI